MATDHYADLRDQLSLAAKDARKTLRRSEAGVLWRGIERARIERVSFKQSLQRQGVPLVEGLARDESFLRTGDQLLTILALADSLMPNRVPELVALAANVLRT